MRRDYRSLETFKKDITFGTKLESFWFNLFLKELKSDKGIELLSYEDYGVNNRGEYLDYANGNADYKIHYKTQNKEYNLLVEIKFCPTFGKATFKTKNLQAYIQQKASILLIYNIGKVDLRQPKDYNLQKHIELISDNIEDIRWGLISYESLGNILLTYPITKPFYMGKKECVILPYEDFKKYLFERRFS